MLPRVTAVVVAYGDEPLLESCVDALLASAGVDVDVVLVDNGCTDGGVAAVQSRPGVMVLSSPANLGFAEGCNVGAAAGSGDFVALVNPDAVVEPHALAHLVDAATDPTVGIASASLRLADRPDHMNSAGNEVHFLGFSWCGALGEPASSFTHARDVACATGAGMLVRRDTWELLGGFAPELFAYYEDSELSLRCWQRGLRVEFVPDAVITHRYEFARHAQKMYLVERNRLIAVLTLYETRTLALLAPALLAVELAMLLAAATQGWARAKLSGWWWMLRHHRWVRRRRAELQRARTVPDTELTGLFTARLSDGNEPLSGVLRLLDALLAAYWRLVRAMLTS